jgi:CRP-like cAMP-binding protein
MISAGQRYRRSPTEASSQTDGSGWPMLTQVIRHPIVRNTILGSLPPLDFACMRPYLRHVAFKERAVLQDHQKPVEHVNFIEAGMVSMRTIAADSVLEIAMIGCRGMVGVSVPLGVGAAAHQSIAAIPSSALSIRAEDLRRLMKERPEIRDHLVRHVQALLIHSAQVAFCGIHHELEQRLASWLCLACDTIEANVVSVTHDYLSMMLSSRRAGVTETLLRFESEGVISKARGMLRVSDRSLLNKKACGCYATIARAYRVMEAQDTNLSTVKNFEDLKSGNGALGPSSLPRTLSSEAGSLQV